MRILILDRDHLKAQDYIAQWKSNLEERGHQVHDETLLRNLASVGRKLSDYELIIAHPHEKDYKQLNDFLENNLSARAILHSGKNSYEAFDIVNSSRVFYSSQAPSTEKLIELISNFQDFSFCDKS